MTVPGEPIKLAEKPPNEQPPAPPETSESEKAQEDARHFITWFLLAILGGTVLAGFCTVWAGAATLADMKGFLPIVVAPVVGLLGTVIGFYFGERSRRM